MEVKGQEGQSLWFDTSVLRVKVESINMPLPSCLMQYGNVYRLHVYFHANQTSFHVKGNLDMACYYINSTWMRLHCVTIFI